MRSSKVTCQESKASVAIAQSTYKENYSRPERTMGQIMPSFASAASGSVSMLKAMTSWGRGSWVPCGVAGSELTTLAKELGLRARGRVDEDGINGVTSRDCKCLLGIFLSYRAHCKGILKLIGFGVRSVGYL